MIRLFPIFYYNRYWKKGFEMLNTSDVTGITYQEEDCVFYRNWVQSAFMLEHGARLVDLFTDSKHKLVFVFTKADHKRIIPLWLENNKAVGVS